MPKGGLRPNSGRKPGTLETKPRAPRSETKTAAAQEMMATHKRRCLENGIDPEIAGMNPVEIMMRAAVMFAMDGDWSKAAQMASMAAPYVVPRLSAVDLNAKIENRDPDDMTLEELSAFIQSARNDNSAEGGAQADRQVA